MGSYLNSGAIFDLSGRYRYLLWRRWEEKGPMATFIMLNPNTADGVRDDPSIRRCMGFARSWGCAGVWVVNLFGYRCRRPRELRSVADPVGPENRRFVGHAVEAADVVVAAWGNDMPGGSDLRPVSRSMRCLGLTQAGNPKHPLYLARSTALVPYAPA